METTDFLKNNVSAICAAHGEFTGYEINIPGLSYAMKSKCPQCLKIAIDKRNGLENRARRDEVSRNISESGIPFRFRESSFTNYEPVIPQDKVRLVALVDYVANFEPKIAANIYLFGGVGLGKTHLGCALATSLIQKGFSAVYTNMITLLTDQKDVMNDKNVSSAEFIARYTTCHFLVIDEFGLSQFTEHEQTILHVVLNNRYERMLPTMIVGNINAGDMTNLVGERIERRIDSSLISITLGTA